MHNVTVDTETCWPTTWRALLRVGVDAHNEVDSPTDDDLVRKSVKRIMSCVCPPREGVGGGNKGNLLANDLAEFVNIVKENFVFGHFE